MKGPEEEIPTFTTKTVPTFNNARLGLLTICGLLSGWVNGYNSAVVSGVCVFLDNDFPEITLGDKSVSAILTSSLSCV
jgi:SP family myo-inositol transporter-like MFS transporter 13